jgi:hypothetical protein
MLSRAATAKVSVASVTRPLNFQIVLLDFALDSSVCCNVMLEAFLFAMSQFAQQMIRVNRSEVRST